MSPSTSTASASESSSASSPTSSTASSASTSPTLKPLYPSDFVRAAALEPLQPHALPIIIVSAPGAPVATTKPMWGNEVWARGFSRCIPAEYTVHRE